LENDLNIILFPEGTSSDGSKVLSFKSSLFGVVDHEELRNYKLQPISISYNKLDGLPLVKTHRPLLAWFGGMNLAPHVWQFLGLGTSEVNIRFHKSKKFSAFLNRKEACKYCFERISQQVTNDYRLLEVDNQIKLNEFKFL
jgi:1-acyl-sn-glycerol-3-phosphate acyltransferase